ncbi:MAG TPA: hypothetical protein VIQ74_08110 [Gemmatimonadaceae bacterium]
MRRTTVPRRHATQQHLHMYGPHTHELVHARSAFAATLPSMASIGEQ